MQRWYPLVLACLALVPGIALELGVYHVSPPVAALILGITIVGAAFLLSWAAEVIQLDISQGLALALLALIAILPEYIVDATFAWLAAKDPEYSHYAIANMTGANRLLIGVAWPLVVVLVWLRTRKTRVSLEPAHGLELIALLLATIYAFVLPIKGTLSLFDCVILVGIFVVYVLRLARMPAEEPHLVGPAATIGALPARTRRLAVAGLGVLAAVAILLVAEPFAHALIETGTLIGVDEFLLVQWLAPLASEAPEFVVVSIFAWRGAAGAALGALVSSKVNQWTLLVAMLPLIYSIGLGHPGALPLDGRQQHEILLTAAQSLFAVLLLLDLRLSLIGAGFLFGMFATQFVFADIRVEMSIAYLVAGAIVIFISRAHLGAAFRGARSAGQKH